MDVSNREFLGQFPSPPAKLLWHPEVMHEVDHDRVCERLEELLWFVLMLGQLERWPPEDGSGELASDLRFEPRFEITLGVFETSVAIPGREPRRARVFIWAPGTRDEASRAMVWIVHGVSSSLAIESIIKRRVRLRVAWIKGHLQDQDWMKP